MIATMIALAMTGSAPCVTPPNTGKAMAKDQPWYVKGEVITYDSRRFEKYGLPRILTASEIRLVGVYKGVAVYLPSDLTFGDEVIYLPVDWATCSFQPYFVKK